MCRTTVRIRVSVCRSVFVLVYTRGCVRKYEIRQPMTLGWSVNPGISRQDPYTREVVLSPETGILPSMGRKMSTENGSSGWVGFGY